MSTTDVGKQAKAAAARRGTYVGKPGGVKRPAVAPTAAMAMDSTKLIEMALAKMSALETKMKAVAGLREATEDDDPDKREALKIEADRAVAALVAEVAAPPTKFYLAIDDYCSTVSLHLTKAEALKREDNVLELEMGKDRDTEGYDDEESDEDDSGTAYSQDDSDTAYSEDDAVAAPAAKKRKI
jgi:hypothetical protein